MANDRLELYKSRFNKVVHRYVIPIYFGIVGLLLIGLAFITESPEDQVIPLCVAGICGLIAFPSILDAILDRTQGKPVDRPIFVIDENGITYNKLTIPWEDIQEISFPRRRTFRGRWRRLISIKLRDTEDRRTKIPSLYHWEKVFLGNDVGHYEMDIGGLTGSVSDVEHHLVKWKRKKLLPSPPNIIRMS